jgi:hypothetical protein
MPCFGRALKDYLSSPRRHPRAHRQVPLLSKLLAPGMIDLYDLLLRILFLILAARPAVARAIVTYPCAPGSLSFFLGLFKIELIFSAFIGI